MAIILFARSQFKWKKKKKNVSCTNGPTCVLACCLNHFKNFVKCAKTFLVSRLTTNNANKKLFENLQDKTPMEIFCYGFFQFVSLSFFIFYFRVFCLDSEWVQNCMNDVRNIWILARCIIFMFFFFIKLFNSFNWDTQF